MVCLPDGTVAIFALPKGDLVTGDGVDSRGETKTYSGVVAGLHSERDGFLSSQSPPQYSIVIRWY